MTVSCSIQTPLSRGSPLQLGLRRKEKEEGRRKEGEGRNEKEGGRRKEEKKGEGREKKSERCKEERHYFCRAKKKIIYIYIYIYITRLDDYIKRKCHILSLLRSVHTIVWDHHGEGSEESLEVVWQLSPASIARVHGDKHRTRLVQLDLTALKHESLGLREDSNIKHAYGSL